MTDTYQSMRPADKVVALSAIRDALDAEIKVQKRVAIGLAEKGGVKSFDTPLGNVTIIPPQTPIIVDTQKLLEFVKENSPELIETIEQVPDWYAAELTDRKYFTIVGDKVTDYRTGEELPYATLGEPTAAYVSWPSSKSKKVGQQRAVDYIRNNVGTLASDVLDLVAE